MKQPPESALHRWFINSHAVVHVSMKIHYEFLPKNSGKFQVLDAEVFLFFFF